MADIAQVRVNNTDYNFADDTKVPYDLLQDTVGFTSKNLLENILESQTKNNITVTVNSNGSVTLSGTASANTNLYLHRNMDLEAGEYVISGYVGGNSNTNRFLLSYVQNGTTIYVVNADGQKLFSIPSGATNIEVQIAISSGTAVNKTVYPMIRKADIMDSTYEPYNPSVKQVLRNNKIIEGKNLIPYPYKSSNSITIQGVTFTVSEDGAITANGTNNGSGTAWYAFHDTINLPNGNYIFSGCPSGGSNTTYKMSLTTTEGRQDTGNGVSVTVNNGAVTSVSIGIGAGYTANNLVFKPMLRKATETDPTYEPYYIPGVVSQEAQNILGVKNLCKTKSINGTSSGLTYVTNEDNIITVSGENTSSSKTYINVCNFILPKGKYIFSGCPANSLSNKIGLFFRPNTTTQPVWGIDFGNNPKIMTLEEDMSISGYIQVDGNANIGTQIFKPMIRLVEIQDDTYTPYAMTNRELTELVMPKDITNDFEFYSVFNSVTKGKICYKIGNIIFITYYVQTPASIDSSVKAILKIPSYLNSMVIGNYVVAKGNTESSWGGFVTVDGNRYLSIDSGLVANTVYRGQLIGILP